MVPITVEPLSAATMRTVFPLIQAAVPGLTLAQWLRFARRMVRRARPADAGVLVARREGNAFPCGSVCYRRERTLADAPILTAEHFIAPGLAREEQVLAALLARLEALARETGCGAVRSLVAGHGAELGLFRLAGHDVDGVVLEKTVPGRLGGVRPETCPTPPGPSPRSRASRKGAARRARRTDP